MAEFKPPTSLEEANKLYQDYSTWHLHNNPGASEDEVKQGFQEQFAQAMNAPQGPNLVQRLKEPLTQGLGIMRRQLLDVGPPGPEPVGATPRDIEAARGVTSLLPENLVEAGMMGGAGVGGMLAGGGLRGLLTRGATAGLGGAAGMAAGGDIGDVPGALPSIFGGQAMAETGRGGALLSRSLWRTGRAGPEAQAFSKKFLQGVDAELDSPGLTKAIAGTGAFKTTQPGPQVRMLETRLTEHVGKMQGETEDAIGMALGGGGTATLNMPSLTTTIPSKGRPGLPGWTPASTKLPTFDEALKAVKDAKSDARVAMGKAAKQDELLQAREMDAAAKRLSQEFDAAVGTGLAAAGVSPKDAAKLIEAWERAKVRTGQAHEIADFITKNPQIWRQGREVALDPAATQQALGIKDVRSMSPDRFPKLASTLFEGSEMGTRRRIGLPISAQPTTGGALSSIRAYAGGLQPFTAMPGQTGPAPLTSALMGLLGGKGANWISDEAFSKPWKGELRIEERGKLSTPVGP